MKNKYLLVIISVSILLSSCQGAQDALQGKSRADRSDEFLVEKKNPLSMPPDINELPNPDLESNNKNSINDQDLKNKLKITSKKNNNKELNTKQNSLDKTILEKIND